MSVALGIPSAPGGAATLEPLPEPLEAAPGSSDLVVVGAGVMGAWTAFFARAGGAGPDGRGGGGRTVTLLDAWGAGHARGTSSDETRIIRASHGDDRLYTRWSRRALDLWRRYEAEWGVRLVLPSGVLWLARRPDGFEARSAALLASLGIPHERLTPDELVRRWPQVAVGGDLDHALHEPEAAALRARDGVRAATAAFQRHGGRYQVAAVTPGRAAGGRLLEVHDGSGRRWSAATFVFAAGPWLPRIFPDLLGDTIRVTKQDVLFIGPAAGDRRWDWTSLPAWCDHDAAIYGIGATAEHGMKIAPDDYGRPFDPTHGERLVDPESVRFVRAYLARRFPDLAGRPVTASRVCQYETTVDGHFLLARHPGYENVWLAGGGSGHGFKHGPRIGEYLVARLDGAPEGAADGDDERRFRIGPRLPGAAPRAGGGNGPGGPVVEDER